MTETLAEKKITTPAGYKHKCTNCMACYNICPSDAIEMIEDIDGFVYPSIVEDKCTHCGLCSKKCPALNLEQTKEISKRLENPLAYGGYINNEEIREKSSSGGVFSILSKYVLDKGGYICGARFTKGGICEHVIVDNWDDLAPLRGSKYVQSNINNCFKEIKKLLELDKYVLFTGTPCQVAGLYSVLGKDYEKLITIDLLCHGTPSQKVFREYLNDITNGHETDIKEIKFRAKPDGWRKPYFCVSGEDFSISRRTDDDDYMSAFTKNMILRKSCTDCQFNRLPRQGDFTIGDFWGVENFNKNIDDDKGTSAILINSTKANNIYSEIKHMFKIVETTTIEAIRACNMINRKSYNHLGRSYFFEKYRTGKYDKISNLLKNALKKKDGIALLNYSYSRINYGSVLTGYALQEKIKKYGYSPLNIIFSDTDVKDACDLSNLRDFQLEYMDFTAPCYNFAQLKRLNHSIQTYIVGPDAMWLDPGFVVFDFNNFKFNFADFSKNICSYAASFGTSSLKRHDAKTKAIRSYTPQEITAEKRLMKRFEHISVREDTGVEICKNDFDVQATHVLDSVFFLSKQEWLKLVSPEEKEKTFDYVSYIINPDLQNQELYDYVLNIKNLESLYSGASLFKICSDSRKYKAYGPTVEGWINNIANCKLLYTDSFHGVCFAVIFNKPFICFTNNGPGYNRMLSLYRMLGLPDRTANSIDDIKRLENEPIDWDIVNRKIQEHLKTSEEFLEKILYSHEHPDPVRGYMESLEILVEQKLNNEALKKSGNPPPARKNGTFWASMFSKNPCGMDTNGSIFLAYLLSKKSKKNTKLITNCSVS